jgi:peptide-methionine (S)-S-oxide reductase
MNQRFTNPLLSSLQLGTLLIGLLGGSPFAAATENPSTDNSAIAVFAGGCFWCTEADFDKVDGVISTTSGYIGGQLKDPSYEAVSSGQSGHIEAVQVRFDPRKTSYAKLLEAYWPSIDPVNAKGQFCDNGPQYLSAIFYNSAEQQQLAQASKAALAASGRLPAPIVTQILPASTFYPAEDYHQDYHSKNPLRYNYYRRGCGRDARLEALWGTPAQQGAQTTD